jgi:nucleoside-diphosphate-sugar epimerase
LRKYTEDSEDLHFFKIFGNSQKLNFSSNFLVLKMEKKKEEKKQKEEEKKEKVADLFASAEKKTTKKKKAKEKEKEVETEIKTGIEKKEIREEKKEVEVRVEEEKPVEEKPKEEKPPLVVITGACGFIGSWAVQIAKEYGFKVRACDLPSAFKGKDEFGSGKARFPEFVKKLADEIAECDITSPETLKDVFKDATYILHIAAILKYDASWDLLYKVNVLGTKNVFDEILKSEPSQLKRVVVWSTNGIYALPDGNEVPITENSLVAPPTRYALSKFLEERLAMMYHRKYGIPVTVIRPTAVYGPRETYMFLENLRAFKKMKFLAIPSNFTFGFPSVHAADVCRAALHLANKPEANGEDYIINDDSNNTAIDIMRFAAEIFDKPFYLLPPVPVEIIRAGIIAFSFISEKILKKKAIEFEFSFMFGYDMRYSNEKLKSTGFEFKYPKFQDGMRETIKWYEENGLI